MPSVIVSNHAKRVSARKLSPLMLEKPLSKIHLCLWKIVNPSETIARTPALLDLVLEKVFEHDLKEVVQHEKKKRYLFDLAWFVLYPWLQSKQETDCESS